MTRKQSAYTRKRLAQGRSIGVVNAAAWQNVVERCQPMGEREPIVQGLRRATDPAALLIEANDALAQLLAHSVAPGNPKPYDCLACITDVAHIRALQIAGPSGHNPMREDLHQARQALLSMRLRWERLGKWGMSALERVAMARAVEHYETVVQASSPQQLHDAEQLRLREVQRGNYFAGEAASAPQPVFSPSTQRQAA